MNADSIFHVQVTDSDVADLVLDEVENMEDLEADLDDLLKTDRPISLDFRVSPRPAISIVDAAELVRERARLLGRSVPVFIHVRTERALDAVKQALARDAQRAVRAMFGVVTVEVRNCSITDVRADAAVNASNTELHLGGGVSGALGRVAGPRLQQAMSRLSPIGEQSIVSTSSFNHTKVSSILHVPTAAGSDEAVRAAYRNVLEFATSTGLRTVALPSLGTGTGGMAPEESARILREEIERWIGTADREITLVVAAYDPSVAEVFARELGAEHVGLRK